MRMKDLPETPLADYISGSAQSAGLTLFQHIPKTAGSSIVHEMNKHIGKYKGIHIDYTRLGADARTDDLMALATDDFIRAYDPDVVNCASGHLRRIHVRQVCAALPDTRVFTFLRHPVDRVISDYRYQCTDQHPPYKEFMERFPTIEHYVDFRGSKNKMWLFLVDEDIDDLSAIQRVENDFSFIGIKEMYPMSVNVFLRMHGSNGMPRAHVRATKDIDANRITVDPVLRAEIERENRRDMVLYDHFHNLLLERRNEWREMRAADSRAAKAAG